MVQPDGRTIEIFRAVAATGSATRAAYKLNTTQPNITRAIGAFEKECGFALFERGRYGMTLTAAGAQLLDVVQRQWAGLRTVAKAIAEMRAGPPGTLHTTTIPFLAEGALTSLIGDYLRDHPEIAVSIKTETIDSIVSDIEMGGSDIGMIIGPQPIGTDLQLLPFGESRLALAVPRDHWLANRASVDFSELHGERFVQLVRPNHIRTATEAMMANRGVKPSLVHEVSIQRTLLALVAQGAGVGLADLAMIQSSDDVVPVALDESMSWPISLIYNGERAHLTMLGTFLAWFERRQRAVGRHNERVLKRDVGQSVTHPVP